MAPFQRDAARRQQNLPTAHVVPKRTARAAEPAFDPRDGQLLRGLVFGLPLGLSIWLLLALLIWKLA